MGTQSNNNNNKSITIDSYEDLIYSILGDDKSGLSSSRILPSIAKILEPIISNDFRWKIVWYPTDNGKSTYPTLWVFSAWQDSNDKLERQRIWQENERVTGWIREANVLNLAKEIHKTTGMSIDEAKKIAYPMVKNGNMELLKVFGLERLITKKEELE